MRTLIMAVLFRINVMDNGLLSSSVTGTFKGAVRRFDSDIFAVMCVGCMGSNVNLIQVQVQ